MDLKYCYPNSDILINKLNIRDKDKLSEMERKLTAFRALELIEEPMEGQFDFRHLQRIHAFLFQDIYEWAGEVRTVDIAKGTMFCKVQFIMSQAEEIFSKLEADKFLNGFSKEKMIPKLAYYFSEINALHPFREGNGRAQREFIRQLAMYNGYILRFTKITKDEMLEASKDSFLCKYDKMKKLFEKIIE